MIPGSSSALYTLLREGSSKFTKEFFIVLSISGIANGSLLAVINTAADQAANQEASGRYLALFVIVLVAYIVCQRHILSTSVQEVERILHGIRDRISKSIRRASLLGIESIGRAEIYANMHRETVTISQATSTVVMAGQSAVMVAFSLAYLAWLSRAAFMLTVLTTGVAVVLHMRRVETLNQLLRQSHTIENRFFSTLTHMLDGFKEVTLHEPRGQSLGTHVSQISSDLHDVKVKSGVGFGSHLIFGQASLYVLLGSIVFLMPKFGEAYSEMVIKATASVLFIVGPLSTVIVSVPIMAAASVAAENIRALEKRLEAIASTTNGPQPPVPVLDGPIHLDGVQFEYPAAEGVTPFAVGPIDLTIAPGEILFIVGGNGSGKSTLLRLLTGLYQPNRGLVRVNGTPVIADRVVAYRGLYTAVFSDYHLFDRLYGLEAVPEERVTRVLHEMELDQKVKFVDGHFTTLELSGGQKKRLALVVALLEDRPVLVLDEWAADQDPTFRKHFYEDILPGLKREGRTIIAATHDDRYFGVADRVLKLEYGQIVKENTA
jgi:putative ATP-binding cassette transporter